MDASQRRPNTSRFQDLTGRKFGRLTVISFHGVIKFNSHWECLCDCGTSCVKPAKAMLQGATQSCGCLIREGLIARTRTHGLARLPEHKIWRGMVLRCSSKARGHDRERYYDRGIRVCPEWLGQEGYERFIAHIGPRPSPKHSVDRINNNGNYEPGNVRWATQVVQVNNRRGKVLIEWNGQSKYLYQWADEHRISRHVLYRRLLKGWSVEKALTIPMGIRFSDDMRNGGGKILHCPMPAVGKTRSTLSGRVE